MLPQSLTFGTSSSNRKTVPNRVEIWSMFNKVQIVELVFITHIFVSYFLLTDYIFIID